MIKYLFLILTLLICPWDKTCAWVFADLWWNGKPYDVCPRQTLKRQIQKNAEG
jgi:glutamine synthetase